MELMPREPLLEVDRALQLLCACGRIERFVSDTGGWTYYRIARWQEHQRIDHPSKSKILREDSRKLAIPTEVRRQVARNYGCLPGQSRAVECFYCGALGEVCWHALADGQPSQWVTFPGMELDHVEPEAVGGVNTSKNIVLACRACNRSKGHKPLPEFFASIVLANSREDSRRLAPERKGKERNREEQAFVCNSAFAARDAELHTRKSERTLYQAVNTSVESKREEILNNSSTRAFDGPETDQSALAGDDPEVLDFVAEARRIKAEQDTRDETQEPATFLERLEIAPSGASRYSAATSLDSTTSRVDNYHSCTEPAENTPKPANKIASGCPESDVRDLDGATPPGISQTGQAPTDAPDVVARELPLDTSKDIIGDVLPDLPGDQPDWVALILSLYGKGRHAARAKTAVIDAITREVAQGSQPSEAAAASWLFERTQCFTRDYYPTWPAHERKFLWDAAQFYNDGHYADDESTWRRDAQPTADERRAATNEASARAVVQQLRQSRSDHHSLPASGGPAPDNAVAREPQSVRPSLGGFTSGSTRAGLR